MIRELYRHLKRHERRYILGFSSVCALAILALVYSEIGAAIHERRANSILRVFKIPVVDLYSIDDEVRARAERQIDLSRCPSDFKLEYEGYVRSARWAGYYSRWLNPLEWLGEKADQVGSGITDGLFGLLVLDAAVEDDVERFHTLVEVHKAALYQFPDKTWGEKRESAWLRHDTCVYRVRGCANRYGVSAEFNSSEKEWRASRTKER